MARGITRRDALRSIGALAGAAAAAPHLIGCGDGATPERIQTIVVLMMENRSYDHYLGSRSLLEGKPGDGLRAGMANPDAAGTSHPIYRESVDCIADPPHGWTAAHNQWNAGANDGFVVTYQRSHPGAPPYPMGYFTREELPAIHGLADAYTSCDRWFSSVLGPTWPNRLYLCAGQSGGSMVNGLPPSGEKFTFPTIFDRLDAARVEWAYYYSDAPFLGAFARVPLERMLLLERFFQDAAAGKLPPVVFVDPAFTSNDDHPPHHPLLGQQMIASVYAALATSPHWNELLFVVTYDEHGGFHDHVAPPPAPDERSDFRQLGFRVPAIVAGPYARRGHLSSVQHDHTSVLRHIERRFGLEPLTVRDAAATDLSDCLDAALLAAGTPAPPVTLPAVEVDASMIDRSCFVVPKKPTELELEMDAGLVPPELDGRGSTRERLLLIGEVLDRAGMGRIRRR